MHLNKSDVKFIEEKLLLLADLLNSIKKASFDASVIKNLVFKFL
jgi:hypothetical protein